MTPPEKPIKTQKARKDNDEAMAFTELEIHMVDAACVYNGEVTSPLSVT